MKSVTVAEYSLLSAAGVKGDGTGDGQRDEGRDARREGREMGRDGDSKEDEYS